MDEDLNLVYIYHYASSSDMSSVFSRMSGRNVSSIEINVSGSDQINVNTLSPQSPLCEKLNYSVKL